MIITRESPWYLLHFGLLVLLALQAALIAARVLSSGGDAVLGAPLGVMAATVVLAASNRRLGADPHVGILTGWLVALRGVAAPNLLLLGAIERRINMRVVLAIISVFPFVVEAETLYVQYEGVVVPSTAPLREGYHIGDRVSGTLLIDSLLAPRTNVQPDNGFAFYQYPGPYGTDFVTGWVPGGKEARDFVIIERGGGPNLGSNSYEVVDRNPDQSLAVFAISPLIKTLDLVQTFDIKEEDENGGMWGFFEWGRGLVEQAVFRMTRFSVTPGRCRP